MKSYVNKGRKKSKRIETTSRVLWKYGRAVERRKYAVQKLYTMFDHKMHFFSFIPSILLAFNWVWKGHFDLIQAWNDHIIVTGRQLYPADLGFYSSCFRVRIAGSWKIICSMSNF